MGRNFSAAKRHTSYPAVFFYLIRFFQLLLSSIIVATIYFLFRHITRPEPHIPMIFPVYFNQGAPNEMRAPWFWLTIHITGHVTLGLAALTTLLHCCHKLNPVLNLTMNILILGAWSIGFGGLINYTVRQKIETNCGNQLSCRLYNLILACNVLVIITMLAAIVLDIHVLRLESRGAYRTIINGAAAGEKGDQHDDEANARAGAEPDNSLLGLGHISLKPIVPKRTLKPLLLVTANRYEPIRGGKRALSAH